MITQTQSLKKRCLATVFSAVLALGAKAQLYVPSSGVLYLDNGAILTVNGGDVTINADITGTGTGKLVLNGASLQNITANAFKIYGLEVNNAANVRLLSNAEVSGPLTLTAGALQINGNVLTLSGTAASTSGTITGSALSDLTIGGTSGGAFGTLNFTSGTGNNLLENLTVNRSGASASVTLGNALQVNTTVTLSNGTLNTGGFLTLTSSSTATARIASITGTGDITGNVTTQRYVPGKRAFRFFAHPFSSSIALSQLASGLDITGVGGATNGFTPTLSNAPSAFWYNPLTGVAALTNDPGWTAYTSTNGVGVNAWARYQTARILVRGTVGQGLDGNTYTPNATTFSIAGAVNTGNQTISLTKGTNSGYNLIGNPFPSQINVMPALQAATNVGASIWVWDATQGTKGGYTSTPISATPYVLPMHGAITVDVSANTSVQFTESHKVATTPVSYFRTSDFGRNTLQLSLETDAIFWDRILLFFNDKNSADKEIEDAIKFTNPDVNFYTVSADNQKLSIDRRAYKAEQAIPVAVETPATTGNFAIKVADYNMDADKVVYLHDKYLNKWQLLASNTEYNFSINADIASKGIGRFELVQKAITPISTAKLNITISPNPSKDLAFVSYQLEQATDVTIRVLSTDGKQVALLNDGVQQANKVKLNTANWSKGTYMIQLCYGTETAVAKLIKE